MISQIMKMLFLASCLACSISANIWYKIGKEFCLSYSKIVNIYDAPNKLKKEKNRFIVNFYLPSSKLQAWVLVKKFDIKNKNFTTNDIGNRYEAINPCPNFGQNNSFY